jgi:hypothetical protein
MNIRCSRARRVGAWIATAWAVIVLCSAPLASTEQVVIDTFEDVGGWSKTASTGVEMEIALDYGLNGLAMRIDFDFHGGGGFVIARKTLPLKLPPNYVFSFDIRGEAPANTLEFKLLDPELKSVWWAKQRNFDFPEDWKRIHFKTRHFEPAWGPATGSMPQRIGAVEIAISAFRGGKGSIWIDNLTFTERKATAGAGEPPLVLASSSIPDQGPDLVFDDDPDSRWHSGALSEDQWLLLDFKGLREYGGLVLNWDERHYARAYDIQASDDGTNWTTLFSVNDSNGGQDFAYLPDGESRYLRLNLRKSSQEEGYAIRSIELKPYSFSSSPNQFFAGIASHAPRGHFPRYFLGEQTYWTVVGVNGDNKHALFNEDATVEFDDGGFSIEPFLHLNGRFISWADVESTQHLEQGYMPIPTVTWHVDGIQMTATALAGGKPGDSSLFLRYRVQNDTPVAQVGNLFLAIRPFQVNPPWQSLLKDGGVVKIRSLSFNGIAAFVERTQPVIPLVKADSFGASVFEQGAITEYLAEGTLPERVSVTDSFGFASGAMRFHINVPPGGSRDIYVEVPFHSQQPAQRALRQSEDPTRIWVDAFAEARQSWQNALNRTQISLPAAGRELADSIRSNLAYVLITADGPALQPGPRTYRRVWIRDGTLMSLALLRMGHSERVRDFIRWYTPFRFASGAVPCCVDWRGADSVIENDSHGQWIHLIAEYYRYTQDLGLLLEMWPAIVETVEHINNLTRQRMTAQYESGDDQLFYGLVPESISHEGYASGAVHSYWDGFFSLLGLKDAAELAGILGMNEEAQRFAHLRERFREDLYASMHRSIERHDIDYMPGSAELGDFDFTSSVIAVDPVDELAHVPQPAFDRTLEQYYALFEERRDGGVGGDWAFTPYEVRIIGPLARMRRGEQAHELLSYFLGAQRPAEWNQWAEVVWANVRKPAFIGDMPHTWVGAEFIRSARDLFVFETSDAEQLVVGAGIQPQWVTRDEGVDVKRMPTYYGLLNYTMRLTDTDSVEVHMTGDVVVPKDGILLVSPRGAPLKEVKVDGQAYTDFTDHEVTIRHVPANVELVYEDAANAE